MKKKIAQIAIIKPLHSLFDYEIPESMESDIKLGSRVSVEFGKRLTIGFVININNNLSSSDYKLKKIQKIIDKSPTLDQEILKQLMWVSNYYHAPLGQILGLATPLYLRQGKIIEEYS